ncbi:hypothetical protein JCM3765_001882 [Sporobolomyces pararoseus]
MPPLSTRHHDPHSNRFLLLSIFVFASLLLYLTTHKPTLSTPVPKSPRVVSDSTTTTTVQKPLVVSLQDSTGQESKVIQHRIVAIGDIHGDFLALTKILRKAFIINLKGQWIGGETVLVQTGDIVDRGVDTIVCYKFLQSLRDQAEKFGGKVISLLGNHEIMNALGDWRYVNKDDIKSFGGERNRREAMSSGWIGQEWRQNYSITARVPYLVSKFPSNKSITRFHLDENKKFTSEPENQDQDQEDEDERDNSLSELEKDGAVNFVHGGIIPEYLKTLSSGRRPISEINRIGTTLMNFLKEKPFPISLPKGGSTVEQRLFWSEQGPMWNRDLALQEPEELLCTRVEKVLKELKVRRLVVGHTPNFEGIVSRCRGKVLLIDTGISRAYGGSHSFLEILHTLTPSEEEKEHSYNEVLGVEEDQEGSRKWIEHELVKAVYEERENSGLPKEEILEFKSCTVERMDSTSSSKRLVSSSSSSKSSVPLHRCRFPDYTPSSITCLALTPTSFNVKDLGCGFEGEGGENGRGILAVGRSNGTVELMIWGGYQGWVNWRTLPSSFPPTTSDSTNNHNNKKPINLLSHLTWSHQTSLSESDLLLYSDDLKGAEKELEQLKRGKGLRLFGVGGLGSELVEWEWNNNPQLGGSNAVGMIKSTLPTLPPIFSISVSPTSSTLAISCEDSTIRLINILDGELELISKIDLGSTSSGGGKVRALSLAWGKPRSLSSSEEEQDDDEEMEEDEDEKNKVLLASKFSTRLESYLLAGCSNSTIRRFDAPPSGKGLYRGTLRMTLDKLKGEQTVVWCLTSLGDGTVVSGDSMGNVKFWDVKFGTQLQSFKSHKSDILCLGIGSDGKSIYTSGIDQKTVEFRQVKVTRNQGQDSQVVRWIQSSGRRLHSHDVRAIVISPPYEPFSPSSTSSSSLVPVMTSAGLDLSLILTPVASPLPPSSSSKRQVVPVNPVSNNPSISFESTVHRRQAYVGSRSIGLPFSLTTKPTSSSGSGHGGHGRLLLGRRDRSIGIWRLNKPSTTTTSSEKEEEEEGGGFEKLLDLEFFKSQTNLISSKISPNGKWFAVSDLYETKLYRLINKNPSGELIPRRQKTFLSTLIQSNLKTDLGTGSSCIEFSENSQKLFLTSAFGSSVTVLELGQDEDETFKVLKVFGQEGEREKKKKESLNGNGDVEMSNGNDSEDSQDDEEEEEEGTNKVQKNTIVALTSSQDGKWLATADLNRSVEIYNLETNKHYLTLPTPPSVPTAISFLPSTSSSSSLEPTLLLTFSNNILLLYGLESKRFHPWSLPLSSSKYNPLTDLREPSLGVTFQPTKTSSDDEEEELVALVWGANWVGKIDLKELKSTNFGGGNADDTNKKNKNKKKKQFRLEADRKRAREEDEILPLPSSSLTSSSGGGGAMIDIKITRKYQPLFLFEFIQTQTPQTSSSSSSSTSTLINGKKENSNTSSSSSKSGGGRNNNNVELVAVERTWYDIVGSLPEAFFQTGVFGT